MQINDINEKSWSLLSKEFGDKNPFKHIHEVPRAVIETYKTKYTNEMLNNTSIITLDLTQTEYSDWGKVLEYVMYPLDNMVEARGGYQNNGMEHTLFVIDTKENILSWLELVNDTAITVFKNEDKLLRETDRFVNHATDIVNSTNIRKYKVKKMEQLVA